MAPCESRALIPSSAPMLGPWAAQQGVRERNAGLGVSLEVTLLRSCLVPSPGLRISGCAIGSPDFYEETYTLEPMWAAVPAPGFLSHSASGGLTE